MASSSSRPAPASFTEALRAAREAVVALDLWEAAETAARAEGREADVAKAYRAALGPAASADVVKTLGRRAVDWHDEAGEPSGAMETLLGEIFARDASSLWAFDRLKLVYGTDERWGALLDFFDAAIDRAPDAATRLEWLEDAARIAREYEGDRDRAIGYLERVVDASPGDDASRATLEKLYEATGRWEPLAAMLRARLDSAEGADAIALRLRLADVAVARGEDDEALDLCEALIVERPDLDAPYERVERIFVQRGQSMAPMGTVPPPPPNASSPPPDHLTVVRKRAAALLRPRYEAAGLSRELSNVLRAEARAARDASSRARTLRSLLELQRGELADDAGAFETVASLLALEPGESSHRVNLAALAASLGREERRARVLAGVGERTEEPALRAALLSEAARVYLVEVGVPERAIDLHARVLATDGLDDATALEAARELDRLLSEAGREAERCAVLERLAKLEIDPSRRRDALGALARIAETSFGDADRAIRAWRERLALDPADADAVAGVVAALGATGRPREIVATLADAARATSEAERRIAWLRDAARIAEATLGDRDAAVAHLRSLLEAAPGDAAAEADLARLYRSLGALPDLADLLRARIAAAVDASARIASRLELAAVLVESGDDAPVVPLLAENLAEDATHAASVAEMARLLAARGAHAELATLWEEQARAHAAAGRVEDAAGLFARAAALVERELGDVARAIADHACASDAGHAPSLDAMARLHEARGEHREAARALERFATHVAGGARADVALRLAAALDASARVGEARGVLEQAARTLDDPRLREALAGLYRRERAFDALAALLVEEADRANAPARVLACLREAAALHLVRRADPEAAVPVLVRAVALAPDDAALATDLGRALGVLGRVDEATSVLRAALAAVGSRRAKDRADVHRELALVLAAAGRRAEAIDELTVATRTSASDLGLRLALGDVALDDGQLDLARRTYRALLLVAPKAGADDGAGPSRAAVLLRLADVAERAGDFDAARDATDSAMAIAEKSAADARALERDLRRRKNPRLLARLLEARVGRGGDAHELAACWDELARLREVELGRPSDAVDARLSAIALEPRSDALHEAALSLARATGTIDRYARALAALANDADDVEGELALLGRLASVQADDLGDGVSAVATYERADALATRAGAPRASILASLAASLAKAGQAKRAIECLERWAVLEADLGASAAAQAEPFYRIAELAFGDPLTLDAGVAALETAWACRADDERAERLLRAASAVDPTHERVVRLFERLSRAPGRERALVDALVLAAGVPGGSSASLREAAELALKIGDGARSDAILAGLISRAPGTADAEDVAWALVASAQRRLAEGRLADAADLQERAALVADPARRFELLREAAQLCAGPLAETARAADLYDRLAILDPSDLGTLRSRLDVLRRLGDRPRLAAAIDAALPYVEGSEERIGLRLELLALAGDEQGEAPERAVRVLEDILAEDPRQKNAAMLLGDLLGRAGRGDDAEALYAAQLEGALAAGEASSAIAFGLRLAAAREAGGRVEAAIAALESALALDGGNVAALRALARLAESAGQALARDRALERLLGVESGDDAVVVATRLADLRASSGDFAGAEAALEAGHAASPRDEAIVLRLVASYEASKNHRKLAAFHVEEAARRRGSERVASLLAAARLYVDELGELEAAVSVLAEAAAAAPDDVEVARRQLDVLRGTGRLEQALAIATAAVAATQGAAWSYRERAAILLDRGASAEAIADLDRVLAVGSDADARAVAPLARRALEATVEPATARALRLRLADVLERADAPESARGALLAVVSADARDEEALRRLVALEARAGAYDAALDACRQLLSFVEGTVFVEIALEHARICELAGRLVEARRPLEGAWAIAREDAEVRRRLLAVYEAEGDVRRVSQILLEDASAETDPTKRFDALLAAGRILVEKDVGEPDRAVQVLERARELRPDDVDAVVLLAKAKAAVGQLDEAIALLNAAAAAQKRRSRPLAILHERIAELQLDAGDIFGSLDSLLRASAADPLNAELALLAGQRAMDVADLEAAGRCFRAITLMRAGDEGPSRAVRSRAYFHLAILARTEGDVRKARVMAEKALAEDDANGDARALLAELAAG